MMLTLNDNGLQVGVDYDQNWYEIFGLSMKISVNIINSLLTDDIFII